MKTSGVVALVLVALTATQGCKQKQHEPVPGPKAGTADARHVHAAGIAWFQENIEEAFSRTETVCPAMVSEKNRQRRATQGSGASDLHS